MPTNAGILTFISMINTPSERLKARNFFICRYFRFYEQLKFRAQFYNLGAISEETCSNVLFSVSGTRKNMAQIMLKDIYDDYTYS